MNEHHRTARREFLKTAALGAATLAATGSRAPAAPRRRPPNLLFIHVDQQHWQAMSCLGNPHVSTPHMDRLAARGVNFVNTYAANPVCCPARASWYTGRSPCEHGVVSNEWPLAEELPDLGQWFGARGYLAAYAGKWHVPGRGLFRSFNVLTPGSGLGEVTDGAVSRAGEAFLHGYRGDQPFFLSLGFLQPHDCCYWVFEHTQPLAELPYDELADRLPPLPANHGYDEREPETFQRMWRGGQNRRTFRTAWSPMQWRYYEWAYYRMVEMVDAELGRVLDALDDSGHAEDTLVLFGSDHGDGIGRHQMVSKMFHYDEAAKTTFIASWPGHAPEGVVDERLISGLDVPATLCDYAGIEAPPHQRGRSIRPLLDGRAVEWREFVIAETVQTGRMVRTPEWKLVTYEGDATSQLFDVRADAGELHNRWGEAGTESVERDLRRSLADWQSHLEPLDLTGRNPRPPA